MLYWFAMLIDAERIERDVRRIERLDQAELHAAGFHKPAVLRRERDRLLTHLRGPVGRHWSTEQLIAYAREAQRRAKGLVS